MENEKALTAIEQFRHYFSIGRLVDYISSHLISTAIAIILIIFYKKIRNLLSSIINKSLKKVFLENPGIATFLGSITTFIIDVVLIFVILNLFGVNFTGIAALFGALSLVIGFAFKDTLSNFLGGLILLTFKPFIVNDVIEYNGYIGTVKKIEIFYTTMVNFQNEEIIVPNGNMISNEIRNINSNSHRRLDIQVGVGYNTDLYQVKQLILKIIEKRRNDLFYIDEVQPIIGLYEIGASSLNIDIRVFVRENMWLIARYYLYEEMKTVFDAKGIDLPFNIVDLQLNSSFNNVNLKNVQEFPIVKNPNIGPIRELEEDD